LDINTIGGNCGDPIKTFPIKTPEQMSNIDTKLSTLQAMLCDIIHKCDEYEMETSCPNDHLLNDCSDTYALVHILNDCVDVYALVQELKRKTKTIKETEPTKEAESDAKDVTINGFNFDEFYTMMVGKIETISDNLTELTQKAQNRHKRKEPSQNPTPTKKTKLLGSTKHLNCTESDCVKKWLENDYDAWYMDDWDFLPIHCDKSECHVIDFLGKTAWTCEKCGKNFCQKCCGDY
jgi:hypothetical protein